jgi:hypothetical protein
LSRGTGGEDEKRHYACGLMTSVVVLSITAANV